MLYLMTNKSLLPSEQSEQSNFFMLKNILVYKKKDIEITSKRKNENESYRIFKTYSHTNTSKMII